VLIYAEAIAAPRSQSGAHRPTGGAGGRCGPSCVPTPGPGLTRTAATTPASARNSGHFLVADVKLVVKD